MANALPALYTDNVPLCAWSSLFLTQLGGRGTSFMPVSRAAGFLATIIFPPFPIIIFLNTPPIGFHFVKQPRGVSFYGHMRPQKPPGGPSAQKQVSICGRLRVAQLLFLSPRLLPRYSAWRGGSIQIRLPPLPWPPLSQLQRPLLQQDRRI